MPIYEYACGSCDHHFETKQRFDDEPIAECPQCGQTVRRVFHPAGIIFKGSGFYINDSRNSSTSSVAASKPANGSDAESGSKTEKSAEPVSATTTESN